MPDENNHNPGSLNSNSADFGTVPHAAEGFGKVPHASEPFGTVPHDAETFGTVPHTAEPLPASDWREHYTLTVRETARLFEAAGVARSERSIVNWCQKNRQGIARLEAYFDPNERRYFITRQSVDTVIAEEKARAAKHTAEPVPQPAEEFGTQAKPDAEAFRTAPDGSEGSRYSPPEGEWARRVEQLQNEKRDLEIANRWKDYAIGRLEKERDAAVERLVEASRQAGQLETQLHQLQASAESSSRRIST